MHFARRQQIRLASITEKSETFTNVSRMKLKILYSLLLILAQKHGQIHVKYNNMDKYMSKRDMSQFYNALFGQMPDVFRELLMLAGTLSSFSLKVKNKYL